MKSLALALFAATCLAGAAHAAARPTAVIPLEPYRKVTALRASVNGQAGYFLFDTAGGVTLLSPDFAAKIGCKPHGRVSGFQMMGDRLDAPRCDDVPIEVSGLKLTARTAAVLDVAPLVAKDAAPVDGSLALDAFEGRAVTLDVTAGRLIVESPASLAERSRRGREFRMTVTREIQGQALAVNLEANTAEGPVRFELDSGNGGTILIAAPFAKLFGLTPNLDAPQSASFDLAEGVHVEGPAFAPEKMILDGNLGMPFLRAWAVTMDLKAGRLWLTPTGS